MNTNKLEIIESFIKKHHVLTIATSYNNTPWCASSFYAYSNKTFVIAGEKDTKHIKNGLQNNKVAGNIHLETKEIGKIEGLQFAGILKEADENEKKLYFETFPFSKALRPALWSIKVSCFKYTNNKLGFGKKIILEF